MSKKKFMKAICAVVMITGLVHPGMVTKATAAEVQSSTYLNIGSVSKMYVTVATMQLWDQGKIDLDRPVCEYIPEFHMEDERYKQITVRMLMNHTAGFMGTAYGEAMLFGEASSKYHDQFLEILSKERLKYSPGEFTCYCNDGFTMLEILVERVSNMTFSEYLEKKISKPLKAENTCTGKTIPDLHWLQPYYLNGKIRLEPECLQVLGAGGVISNAEELGRFGTTFFEGDRTLLSENAKMEMAKDYGINTPGENFGLGWDTVGLKDYTAAGVQVLQKGGDTNFHHASLTVVPKKDISIAVVSSGGSSSVNEAMAQKLLDLVLEEQGISITHPEEEIPVLVGQIPEEYKEYEGLYTSSNAIYEISFPNLNYLQVRSLTSEDPSLMQLCFTQDGEFVKMSGDVESGKAMVEKPVDILTFEKKDGKIYLREKDGGYALAKVAESKVVSAWEARNGKSYFYCSGAYNDQLYFGPTASMTLKTDQDARGYVNGWTMIDETHAKNLTYLPGSGCRDISDVSIQTVDGSEILTLTDDHSSYVSEDSIEAFTKDTTEVKTKTGMAQWYKLEDLKDVTVKLDIPEAGAVYVYDRFGNVKYTNFMTEYNGSVPLPEYGMIVFIGETGSSIGIEY